MCAPITTMTSDNGKTDTRASSRSNDQASERVDTESGAKPSARKRLYRLGGGAVVLIVLVVVARQAWLILQPPPQAAGQESVAVAMDELQHRFALLERRLETVADEKPKVVPVASNELWWIAESERYLTEAVERLDSGADVKPALSALRAARQTLAGVELAAAKTVRQALEAEIRALNEYHNADAEQAVTVIDEMLERLERGAAPAGPTDSEPASAAAAPGRDGLWAGFSDGLSRRFKRLVVVGRKGGDEARQVTRGVAMRSLLLARTAVLGGDDVAYRYAVANAMRAFEQTVETDAVLYGKLQILYALDVAGAPPRIGTALAEIRALARRMTP